MIRFSFFYIVGLCLTACGNSSSSDAPADGGMESNVSDANSGSSGTIDGPPFWSAVSLENAQDYGHNAAPIPDSDRQNAGNLILSEVTDAAGLSSALAGGNTHGVGVAFLDLNGDDYPDVFVANGLQNGGGGSQYQSLLYLNTGDGTFTDASSSSGISSILNNVDAYSVSGGDYDRDGDVDLYIGAQTTDFLLQNQGDGTFVDATSSANAGGPASDNDVGNGSSKIVSFGDYDADGFLDIVSASSTLPNPGAYLLRNKGDGTFEDVTTASEVRIHPDGNPCAVLWSDYDNDGDIDLWIWNDRGEHILLANDGDGTFTDADADSVSIGNPMGIDGADIDHDLDLDYYVSNIGYHPLLINNGDGTFNEGSDEAGTSGDYGWGLGFEDFNHDSWPDLFVAQEDDRDHVLYTHNRTSPATFSLQRITHPPVNGSMAHNVAVAFADYDRDGRVDVLVAGTDGSPVILYRNETTTGTHGWLDISVVNAPGTGEYGAIGGRVAIKTGDLIQFRDITGGSSRASQNELSVRFGLDHWDGVEWIAILWPNGSQLAAVNVPANQHIKLSAP